MTECRTVVRVRADRLDIGLERRLIGGVTQWQGYPSAEGQEDPQDSRYRRQEAPDRAQEVERPAHPGHRRGQHV